MKIEIECNRLESKTQEAKLDKIIEGVIKEIQNIGIKVISNTNPRYREEE